VAECNERKEEIDEAFIGLQQHYAVMDAHDVQVLSFRVSGFRILSFRVSNVGFLSFRVSGFGFRVSGFGVRVWGVGGDRRGLRRAAAALCRHGRPRCSGTFSIRVSGFGLRVSGFVMIASS